jgi:hypothetical protein
MRRLAVMGVVLACSTLAVAQENTSNSENPGSGGSAFSKAFNSGDSTGTKKTSDKKKADAAPSPVSLKAKEEITLDRRNQVILKLREIAERTNDEALTRKADELYERANAVYLQRTSAIPALGVQPVKGTAGPQHEALPDAPVPSTASAENTRGDKQ